MGGQFVKGVASAGVIPSSKHFIMNEQETNRDGSSSGGGDFGGSPPSDTGNSTIVARQSTNDTTTSNSTTSTDASGSYNVAIGDKAFHETYLAPFYDSVKNGVAGTMCKHFLMFAWRACQDLSLL